MSSIVPTEQQSTMNDEFEKRIQAYLDEDIDYGKEKIERKEVVDILRELMRTKSTRLDLEAKFISKLPPIPQYITHLNIQYTEIKYIGEDELPDSLIYLNCRKSRIRNLPKHLPSRLEKLICSNNPILELPALPDTLKVLHCEYTFVSALPDVLPASLRQLSIHNTLVSSLPELPPKFEQLCCGNTFLPPQRVGESYVFSPGNKYLEKLKRYHELIKRQELLKKVDLLKKQETITHT